MLNNKTWWKAAFVRTLKTVAQTAVASLGTAVGIYGWTESAAR